MREYGLIMLNMLEYARILNVSDAVHSIRSLCKLLSSYREREREREGERQRDTETQRETQRQRQREACSGHCHTFKMDRFVKE